MLCSNYQRDDCYHVLFNCSALNETREEYLARLYDVMPQAMANVVNEITIKDKVKFLLSPLNSRYIPEWNNIYVAIASFVFAVYSQRANIYDENKLELLSV